jgi:hypothetical protein
MKTKFIAATLLLGSLARGQERPDVVIAGGTVVTVDDQMRVLEGGALVIEGSASSPFLLPGASPEARKGSTPQACS